MKYDPMTRLLHLLVAAGITGQMLISQVMITPKPGRVANGWFELHENLGIFLFGAVSVYWLWIIARTLRQGEPMLLFPWFSRRRLEDLWEDTRATLQALRQGRLPVDNGPTPFPSAIQGGGLLVGLALAASGTVIALGMGENGETTPFIHMIKEGHETIAPLMWAYLAVHPLMGLLHQLAGHHTLSRMFGRG